jgi:hypothetical protein
MIVKMRIEKEGVDGIKGIVKRLGEFKGAEWKE